MHIINEEVSKKFKDKTTAPLKPTLGSDGIISYAYFFKNMKFKHPFSPKKIMFRKIAKPGFSAKGAAQK